MNLEHELRGLPIDFPPEPDLVPRVRERLERPSRRRWLILALAAVAAIGALLAIPPTRAAIFDLFHIGGVEVKRVPTQPQAPSRVTDLGREVGFGDAQSQVDFPLAAPDTPFTTYYDGSVAGGMVNMTWNGFVLSQWHGDQLSFAQKQVGHELADGVRLGERCARPMDHRRAPRDRLPRPDRADRREDAAPRRQRPALGPRRDHLPPRGAKDLAEALAAVRNLSRD